MGQPDLPPCPVHGKPPVVYFPCCRGATGGKAQNAWKAARAKENLATARAAKGLHARRAELVRLLARRALHGK